MELFCFNINRVIKAQKPYNHTLTDHYWVAAMVGFCVALSGQMLHALTIGLAYIIRGGKNRRVYAKDLVTEGMFNHCRNPLYLGNILMIAGLSLVANSPLMLFVGLPLFIFAYYCITKAEETFLFEKFGSAYTDFCTYVPRFIPRFSGISETLQCMTFNWKRLVVKEYNTTFTWLAATVLLILRSQYIITNQLDHRTITFGTEAMILLIIAYGLARFLKKNKILRAD